MPCRHLAWSGGRLCCRQSDPRPPGWPTFHRQQYAVAEALLSMKIALCRAGSWLLVPGQRRELERALAFRADIREERARFPERSQSRDTASTFCSLDLAGSRRGWDDGARYGADGSDQAATAGQ